MAGLNRKLTTFAAVVALVVVATGLAAGQAAAKISNEESADYLSEARAFVDQKKFGAAVIQLKNALRANPDNVEARFLLGEVYLQISNVASAEKEFRAAIDRGMEGAVVKLRLGQSLLLQGKFQDLLDSVNVDDFEDKARADAHVLIGRAFMGLKNFDQARANFDTAETLNPDGVQAKLGLARLDAEAGDVDKAEALVDKILELQPRFVNALLLKGEFIRQRRDLVGALGYFNTAVELQPRNVVALLGRSATLIDLNRDEEGVADAQAVLKIFPEHPLANYFLALSRTKTGDFAAAAEILAKTGSALDAYMPGIYLKGVINYAQGNFEQAQNNFVKFLKAVPGHRVARRLLGATLIRSGQHREAIETLTPLLRDGEDDSRLNALVAAAYMGVGDYASATTYYEKAAAAAPEQGAIQTQLALSRLATGDSKGAMADLESVVGLDPDASQASVLLALMALRNKDFDRALEVSRKLQENLPDNPMAANLTGAALIGKGERKKAREAFEHAISLRADYYPAATNLAQLDLVEGDVAAAKARYRSILRERPDYAAALFALADLAMRENDRGAAEGFLEKAAAGQDKTPGAGLRLVNFYLTGGEADKALTTASELALRFPENIRVIEVLGKSQAVSGEIASAVASFKKLVNLAPGSAMAQNLLARSLAASGDLPGAREHYDAALKATPNFPLAVDGLVALEVRAGNFDHALELAAGLAGAQPASVAGDILTGDIYMRMAKPDEAATAYRRAQAKQASAALGLRLYRALSAAGKSDEAIGELRDMVDANPDELADRHILANAYLQIKKYPEAIIEYEKLQAADPNNQMMILNNLAWLYEQVGDPRAIEAAEKAFSLAPDSPEVADTLGWIVLAAGDSTRALSLLQKASALSPGEPEIRYHLAVALEREGRGADAVRELQAVMAMGKPFGQADEARALLSRLSRR